jgi:hypothetical protein
MKTKNSTVRLYVALVSLVAALLELGAALARLGTALVLRAAAAVRPRAGAHAARLSGPPNLRVVRRLDLDEERARLTAALVGMGWPAPAVRRFVDSLGDRIEREPIEKLIKEGLARLAA